MKSAAEFIKKNNSQIIEKWEARVRAEIKGSKDTRSLVLRNQLPHVLDDISEIMDRYDDFEEVKTNESYIEIIENSLDHGRHRATTANYTVAGVLKEYMIFHQVLTDELRENDAYNIETGIILKYTIETAMVNSASSFSESINEMKEKLVGTLAHDIRNPISAAYLALDILDPEEKPERIRKVKNMAVNSLDYSIRLIEGLLDAISVEAGEGVTLNFENQDILEDIEWVTKEAKMIFPNDIKMDCNVSEINGVFDGTAIRRVLENLVTNAVKYGDKINPVEIIVRDHEETLNISVCNTGNPIPKEKHEEIFKYLHSEKTSKSGGLKSWGMGLSLVKTVTNAHGGKVCVNSNEKDGTEFKITLDKYKNKPGKVRSHLNYN